MSCRNASNASAGPELQVVGADHADCGVDDVRPTPTRNGTASTSAKTTLVSRAGRADQRVPCSRLRMYAVVDPDRAAGQADAAEHHHDHRQHDRQQRVGVLQRVQRQVAPVGHGRGRRRSTPTSACAYSCRHSETSQPETTNRNTSNRTLPNPVQAMHAADREDRDEAEEDRARHERVARRAAV